MLDLTIPAISCNHCVRAVTEAVHAADPEARVEVDIATKRVQVQTSVAPEAVLAELARAGYAPG